MTADEAGYWFEDPSQHVMGITPDALPDEGFLYLASGPVCGCFHLAPWPGVWMAHYGVRREEWGGLNEPARAVLNAFWDARRPHRIVGWTDHRNRAALAFARRLGFVEDGRMPTLEGEIIMQGWTPWQ